MNAWLSLLAALLSAGLVLDSPVSEWHSPGFVASKSRAGISVRGHVNAPVAARRLEDRIAALGFELANAELERHILLPDWWTDITRQLPALLSVLHSGETRLTAEQLLIQGITTNETDFRRKLETLKRSLPASLGLTYTVSALPADSRESICKRLFAALSFDALLFDHGVTEPGPIYDGRLNRLAEALRRCPDTRLRIVGHSDSFGTAAGNYATSAARANNVAGFLEARGVDAARFDVDALGDSQPVASNATWAGRNQNRRVTISVKR